MFTKKTNKRVLRFFITNKFIAITIVGCVLILVLAVVFAYFYTPQDVRQYEVDRSTLPEAWLFEGELIFPEKYIRTFLSHYPESFNPNASEWHDTGVHKAKAYGYDFLIDYGPSKDFKRSICLVKYGTNHELYKTGEDLENIDRIPDMVDSPFTSSQGAVCRISSFQHLYRKLPFIYRLDFFPEDVYDVIEESSFLDIIDFSEILRTCLLTKRHVGLVLPREYIEATGIFLKQLCTTTEAHTCLDRRIVDTYPRPFYIFFELEYLKKFLALVEKKPEKFYYNKDTLKGLDPSLFTQYFTGCKSYIDFLAESNTTKTVNLDDLINRGFSTVHKKSLNTGGQRFYSETIEIYILGNGLPGSIAFVATVYYSFRPNTTFYILGLTAAPIINFVAFFAYLAYLFLLC